MKDSAPLLDEQPPKMLSDMGDVIAFAGGPAVERDLAFNLKVSLAAPRMVAMVGAHMRIRLDRGLISGFIKLPHTVVEPSIIEEAHINVLHAQEAIL